MKSFIKITVPLLIFLTFLLTGCNQSKLDSVWSGGTVIIDGDDQEWRSSQFVPKGEKIALGIMNDEANLYLSFRTADQQTIIRALSLGFTIWIDPKGGKRQTFGIKYPVGTGLGEMRGLLRDRRASYDEREEQIRFLLQTQTMTDIYGPENYLINRIALSNDSGLKLKSAYSRGQFIFEVQIPFTNITEQTGGPTVSPGARIGVGFIAGEIDREALRSQMAGRGGRGGSRPGGGTGGRGGMGGSPPGGGMGRSGGGNRQMMPDAMEAWFKVKLAEQR
ncbi:MAG: hypothetical protein H8E14_06975 [Candidatus Marinimicrobia bacterium]|nr:hypothetical protein [Candidatus Neomarinimicrobiota bacterium]